MWGMTANQAVGQMSEERSPFSFTSSHKVRMVARDLNTLPQAWLWSCEGPRSARGVSPFSDHTMQFSPKVLMQPAGKLTQFVEVKENDIMQFQLLQ